MKLVFQKHEGTITADLIRWWTKSPYSHVELLFGDGMMFSSSANDGGTRFVKFEPYNKDYWDTIEIRTTAAEDQAIRDFACSELYCKYDWLGIFLSQIVRMHREDPKRWFCSEICTSALQKIGHLKDIRACAISPGQLYKKLRDIGAIACDH